MLDSSIAFSYNRVHLVLCLVVSTLATGGIRAETNPDFNESES